MEALEGQRCLGPQSLVSNCVIDRCSYDAEINDETARLVVQKITHSLRYSYRCARCQLDWTLRKTFRKYHCLASSNASPHCQRKECPRQRYRMANLCDWHLLSTIVRTTKSRVSIVQSTASARFRSNGIYTAGDARLMLRQLPKIDCPPEWAPVVEMARRGDPNLFYADAEGDLILGNITEATILGSNGEVLIHARFKYERTDASTYHKVTSMPEWFCRSSRSRPKDCRALEMESVDMSPADFVAACKAIGMNKGSTIIGWDVSGCDVRAFHKFTAQVGGEHVFPPVGRSPAMIWLWKKILPASMSFHLPFLFPLLFPGDPLIGRNHFSLPDTLQARKMFLLAIECMRLPEQRQLHDVGKVQISLPSCVKKLAAKRRKIKE